MQRAIFLILLLVASPATAEAGGPFANAFTLSLQREAIPLRMDRFIAVAGEISLAQSSLLEQWGLINSDASATYNSLLNTIVLRPESIRRDQGGLRFRTLAEMRADHGAAYSVYVAEVLHEMAHAEYDVFVEAAQDPADARLLEVFQYGIAPWLARNHPERFSFTLSIAAWEIFGYYRGDLMLLMLSDQMEIAYANGLDPISRKCYAPRAVREAMAQNEFAEFLKYMPLGEAFDVPYRQRIRLEDVFALGNAISLKGNDPGDPFRREWFDELWAH